MGFHTTPGEVPSSGQAEPSVQSSLRERMEGRGCWTLAELQEEDEEVSAWAVGAQKRRGVGRARLLG